MTEFRGWAGARERLADRPPESSPPSPDADTADAEASLADAPPAAEPEGPSVDFQPQEAEGGAAVEPVEAAPGVAAAEAPPVAEPEVSTEEGAEYEHLVDEAEERVETDLDELERLAAERDDYVERLQRLQADFQNYRKRIIRQQTEHLERAAEDMVVKLLEVLDNFDLAMAHGGTEHLEPVYRSLMGVLESTGLERLDPLGQPFDPQEQEAVFHEPSEEGAPQVTEVMRPGYRWKGRLLRPAMVKVKG